MKRRFPVWRTVSGNNFSCEYLIQLMKDSGMEISKSASEILNKFVYTSSPVEIEADLAVVSSEDIGFTEGAKLKELIERGESKEFGLRRCHALVAPFLRIAYFNQPEGERLMVVMDPICDSAKVPRIFSLGADKGLLWLGAPYGNLEGFWDKDCRLLYALSVRERAASSKQKHIFRALA